MADKNHDQNDEKNEVSPDELEAATEEATEEESGLARFLSVSFISLLLCGSVSLWGIISPKGLTGASKALTSFSLKSLDWFYLFTCTAFIGLALFLALSRYGHIKLGKPDDEPEFNTVSWLAMLFAAGMGAGLLFWGVAEPMIHFVSPPHGESMSPEAARQAMKITMLHWGFHAWGIYAMGALCLGYFGFRKGYPLLASTPIKVAFPGKFGKSLGGVADVVAVLAVAFGVAGSLGMGVMQIQSGLNAVFGVPNSTWVLVAILGSITVAYMISASTSLDKGIQILSNLNIAVAMVIMLFILFTGPTSFILSVFVTSLGDYLSNIVQMSFKLNPYTGDTEWTRVWTLTYLIWWIAWAPFVGIFIARISRGRTIRQFVIGVVFIPTVFSALWFSVFGGTGLHLEIFGQGGFGSLVIEDVSRALFGFFDYFPLSKVLSITSLFLVFVFLVTSADSASFVLGMMTSKGSLDPPTGLKLFWGTLVAVVTASALFSGGDPQDQVHVMRAIAISGAIPFIFIMILHVASLLKAIFKEPLTPIHHHPPAPPPDETTTSGSEDDDDENSQTQEEARS